MQTFMSGNRKWEWKGNTMLTLQSITKDYGNHVAVEHISFDMENGLYGLLAPNGAGKTTIIKILATLLFPTAGQVLYDGEEILAMGERYRDLLGYLPQQFGYYKNNSPVQYLNYLGALKRIPKKELKSRTEMLLHMVGLEKEADWKMKKFSGGMVQRVGIAQAMLNDPKILVLDEPTAGLDPKERARFRNIISKLSKDRIVVLSTHIVSDIESVANRVLMLKDTHLYINDTVDRICRRMDGTVFEQAVAEMDFHDFQKEYHVLTARQENGYLQVRYSDPNGGTMEATECPANLEDVFLEVYRDETEETL